MAPLGKMRGPVTAPLSMASFSPKAGPPRSRTVVKPRINVAPASRPDIRWMKPMSCVSAAIWRTPTSVACQWQSIRPGMTARPPQSMRRASCGPCPMGGRAVIRSASIRISTPSRIDRVSPSKSRRLVSSSGRSGVCARASPGASPKPANMPRTAAMPPRICRREMSAASLFIAARVRGEPQWQMSMDAGSRPSGRQARHMRYSPTARPISFSDIPDG